MSIDPRQWLPMYAPLFAAIFLGLPLLVGYLIIQPLHERSRNVSAIPVRRYSLLDFVALAVQLQVALAIGIPLLRNGETFGIVAMAILVLGGIIAMWWAGVEAAVRAGIHDGKRRAAIHLVLLPGTAVMMVAIDFAMAMLGTLPGQLSEGTTPDGALGAILPIIVVLICVYLLRLLACWIIMGTSVAAVTTAMPEDDQF